MPQTAREFVNKEVIPIIDSYAQEEKFPAHLVKIIGQPGFPGPTLPEEYNCAGLSNVAYGILMYEQDVLKIPALTKSIQDSLL